MDEKKVAIQVKGLEKAYKLYDKPSDRLKEALGFGRKKRYKEHYALKGVDMTIYQGETVGIIGTNGSGKSTILKIITGVLNPTGGSVHVNGRISALLELGAGFNMEYNGIENIYLNGTMIGFSKKEIDAKMDDILNFADIGDYVHQPVKTYSSGMFVRLAFAVAINIEPEIGKTIVFVSHDLSSISKYCDRVVLLNQGVKFGEGSPKEMIDAYKQVLVGQYVPAADDHSLLSDKEITAAAAAAAGTVKGEVNPELLEYGTKDAMITGYKITDDMGRETSALLKGKECTITMQVHFEHDIEAPIFAFTIKNIKGVEITGTNTMVEKAFLSPVRAGSDMEITFTQKIDLQGGEYLLSFGVTGFEKEEFQVYHRLYDVINMTVISDKDTVGYYDMNSRVVVKELSQQEKE